MPKYSRIWPAFLAGCLFLLATPGRAADPVTLAGITYDAKAPLAAKEVQRKDGEGKPLPLYRVTFLGGNNEPVPALLSVPNAPAKGKRAAVLLLHGLGGDKNQLQALAMMLNGKGVVTLAIDAAGHGERPKVGGKGIGEQDLAGMRTLAAQTVQDLRRAVDYLSARPDIDPKRIGFVGVSLGGILGARFLAEDPRVSCATLWVAGGDWGTLITTSSHPWAKAFRDRGETDAAKIRQALAEVDPVRSLGSASVRPMLFINGDKDTVVPRACSDALIAVAKEPKQAVLLPGDHVPNLFDMASRTIAFLSQHLK